MTVKLGTDPKVRWTEALLRKCEPSIGTGEKLEPWPQVAAAWRRVRDKHLAHAEVWRTGESRASAPYAALMREVDASFASVTPPPPGSLDLKIEAARGAMGGAAEGGIFLPLDSIGCRAPDAADETDAMLDFWGAHSGLAFAVLALLRTEDHRRFGEEDQDRRALVALWLGKPAIRPRSTRPREAWARIRRRLAGAQLSAPDDYEAARSAVATVWPSLSVRDKATLAYAFPSEEAWSEEAADEGLRVLAKRKDPYSEKEDEERVIWLLYALRDPKRATAVAQVAERAYLPAGMYATMLANLGVDAVGPLMALLGRRTTPIGPEGEFWRRVMSAIESQEVATYFASHLDHNQTARVAGEYFKRFPHLAVPVLEAAVRGGSKQAAVLLAGVDPARAGVPAEAAASTSSVSSADEADLSGVPDVLITPPWMRKKPARVKPTVLSIEARSLVPRMDWSEDERTEYLKDEYSYLGQRLEKWLTTPVTGSYWIEGFHLRWVLARLGTEALPNVVATVHTHRKAITTLERVVSNDVVALMAEAAYRLKDSRRFAEAWLLRYPQEAATRLVPAAVGQPGPERSAAEHVLRFLDARQQGDLVRSVAQSYGEACATAIDQILSAKTETMPTRLPSMPPFWAPAHWPRPTLAKSGTPLPLEAIEHLGIMLAASPLDAPMSALAEVKAACDPASLAAFAWGLFEAWQTAGHETKHVWALQALGHLGTDDTARQLDPLIRQWPTDNGLGRATTGLDILATIGSDFALSLLQALSGKKVKSRPLQLRAAQRIQDLAARRGMTSEQLADRLVPDLELDAAGTRILDFGDRQFRIGLDARLKPEVRTLTGERLRDLPKPGARDDEKKAAAAVSSWKAIKKGVNTVVPTQIGRLERAMCESRRWSVSDFLAYIVNHPIVGQLARRVIWTARDGAAPVVSFRVAEDRTFADSADAPFTLPENAEVGLLHPLEVDTATLAAWTQCMVDYEIIQPFEQLGRAVRRPTEEELQSSVISRVDKQTVDTGRVLTLERRGWRRGPNIDSGGAVEMIKTMPAASAEAYLGVSPGIATWLMAEFPKQTLSDVLITRISPLGIRERIKLSALDPISASELLADLDSLIA